jgi:hypothetical protein
MGIGMENRKWRNNSEFTALEIKKWKKADFSLEEAKEWNRYGFSVDSASQFSDFNLKPKEVRQFLLETIKKKHEQNLKIKLKDGIFSLNDFEKLFKEKSANGFL